jgi:hypothetical protein
MGGGGHICGVMVSVRATGRKVREFKPGQDDAFLRAIKIRRKIVFEG